LHQVFHDVVYQKLLKSGYVSRSYSKNNSGTFLLRHGAVSIVGLGYIFTPHACPSLLNLLFLSLFLQPNESIDILQPHAMISLPFSNNSSL